MKIVVTGAAGFIGKNLCLRLREDPTHEILELNHETPSEIASSYLLKADFVFHLAGVNRPKDISEFRHGNVELTKFVVNTLAESDRNTPIVLSSSVQADQKNHYGASKLEAEKIVETYSKTTDAPYYIFRLPNVFGKWCKPNYNSFVATFCYNVMNGYDMTINDPKANVTLTYIDDLCTSFIGLLDGKSPRGFHKVLTEYKTTVGEVASIISTFKINRNNLTTERVGTGLTRALYSTFLSYASPDIFSYSIPSYSDERGVFCEMLKTKDSGQFSFFTAHPGVTRGRHYHHTKSEKFLVIKGSARFRFRHVLTDKAFSIDTSGKTPTIVETIPGWSHDITNNGDDELIVMLWASEIFDHDRPDTIASIIENEKA